MSDNNPTVDQVSSEGGDKRPTMEDNLKSPSTWLRLGFMIIYCVLAWLMILVGSVIVLLGFLWLLFTGKGNEELKQVGQRLATYAYQIVRYLTLNTDEKPYPFGQPFPPAETGD
jgi:Domain of unknown function (DUF4389)